MLELHRVNINFMEVKSNKATPFALSDSAKKKILSLQSNEDKRLFRVYVTGGGCSGFQYGFKFDDLDKDEDHILKFDNELSILLDELSYPYIAGSVVDYKEGLMGAKFTVENPNAKSTCGCGASFSI